MKKILVVLSLICFVAVNVSTAQTSTPVAKAEKKEAVATTPAPATSQSTTKSCCRKGSTAKVCTPEEKAKCEVKGKTEAAAPVKAEEKTTVKN